MLFIKNIVHTPITPESNKLRNVSQVTSYFQPVSVAVKSTYFGDSCFSIF